MLKNRKIGKERLTKPLTILLGLLLIISMVACVTCPKMPAKPVKPQIDVYEYGDYICMEKEDATKLYNYIIDLEAGYE